MIRCAISLGGNLGDVPATFDRAQRSLSGHPGIRNLAVSPRYRTQPVGSAAGDPFLNAAAAFETMLDAAPLLDFLQQIERDCGRVRTVHWGPRTLDLDLLLYGEEIIDAPRLQVPHPALWYRRFVLDPLCDVAPDARHPVFDLPIRQVRDRLLPRPLPVCFLPSARWAVPANPPPHVQLAVAQTAIDAAIAFPAADDAACLPQTVCLPRDMVAAHQMVTDVLSAALDEPARMSS